MLEQSSGQQSRSRFGDRALAAAALVLVVAALLLTRTPSVTAAAPILDVHAGPGGVVVDSPTVTVIGMGEVLGTPDMLTVVMAVTSSAAHASDALDQNNQITTTLIGTLTGAGADPKDVATNGLNIEPRYDRNGQSITGYNVIEQLTVKLHDLSKAGAILDSAARTVGDSVRVQQMSLSISDSSELMAHARQQAVADAKTKAAAMAAGAGVKLGTIKSISEVGSSMPQQFAGAGLHSAAAGVPISPGQQQVGVTVTAVFALGN